MWVPFNFNSGETQYYHTYTSRQVRVGNIKYRCVEGLFNPGLFGKDVIPLHHMIAKAVKACALDQRREICRSIYLTGGSSLIKGMKKGQIQSTCSD